MRRSMRPLFVSLACAAALTPMIATDPALAVGPQCMVWVGASVVDQAGWNNPANWQAGAGYSGSRPPDANTAVCFFNQETLRGVTGSVKVMSSQVTFENTSMAFSDSQALAGMTTRGSVNLTSSAPSGTTAFSNKGIFRLTAAPTGNGTVYVRTSPGSKFINGGQMVSENTNFLLQSNPPTAGDRPVMSGDGTIQISGSFSALQPVVQFDALTGSVDIRGAVNVGSNFGPDISQTTLARLTLVDCGAGCRTRVSHDEGPLVVRQLDLGNGELTPGAVTIASGGTIAGTSASALTATELRISNTTINYEGTIRSASLRLRAVDMTVRSLRAEAIITGQTPSTILMTHRSSWSASASDPDSSGLSIRTLRGFDYSGTASMTRFSNAGVLLLAPDARLTTNVFETEAGATVTVQLRNGTGNATVTAQSLTLAGALQVNGVTTARTLGLFTGASRVGIFSSLSASPAPATVTAVYSPFAMQARVTPF